MSSSDSSLRSASPWDEKDALTCFKKLYQNPELADMVIECGDGKKLHVHKAIVCARSEFIYKAMNGPTEEASSGTLSFEEPSSIVSALLEWLYSGEFDIDAACTDYKVYRDDMAIASFETAVRVAIFADSLLLPDLVDWTLRRWCNQAHTDFGNGMALEPWEVVAIAKFIYGTEGSEDIEKDSPLIFDAQSIFLGVMRDQDIMNVMADEEGEKVLGYPQFLADLLIQREGAGVPPETARGCRCCM